MAKIKDPTDIVLNDTDEVQEILGSPPGWILRWGISIVAVSTIILLVISWIIKYPDIIPAEVELTTQNPPIRVFTRSAGKIDSLLVKDKQTVQVGAVLAILENTAKRSDIGRLEKTIDYIEQQQAIGAFPSVDLPQSLVLGRLQSSYASFLQKYRNYRYFVDQKGATKKIQALQKQIKQLRALNQNLSLQQNTLRKELAIAEKALQRRVELRKDATISVEQLETAEANVLQYKRQIERIPADTISNNIRIEQIRLQILELRQGDGESKTARSFSLEEDLQKMKSEVQQWKQNFLIVAPISGKVSLVNIWSPKQFLTTNQEVLTIVPERTKNGLISKAFLPPIGSGKVKPGMRANIRLADYPYQEFGIISAEVKSIALVPQEDLYQVEIEIPQKLVTTYGKELSFQQEMKGTAHIITEDRRILERIFDKVISAIKNR